MSWLAMRVDGVLALTGTVGFLVLLVLSGVVEIKGDRVDREKASIQ